LAGIGVGICSSVIPYITDQLAMARLPRPTFALMLSLLPAFAAVIGAVILRQVPSLVEMIGIALIMLGVAVHQEPATIRSAVVHSRIEPPVPERVTLKDTAT
jgi:inner membrane transporter RhtA